MTERTTTPSSEPVDAQEETPDSALSAEFDALILSRPRLPLELIRLVATHLTHTYALGTLAALNATCHAVHAETLCALWTRVFLDRRVPAWLEGRGRYRFFRENEERPDGCRYTRYIINRSTRFHLNTLLTLFPRTMYHEDVTPGCNEAGHVHGEIIKSRVQEGEEAMVENVSRGWLRREPGPGH